MVVYMVIKTDVIIISKVHHVTHLNQLRCANSLRRRKYKLVTTRYNEVSQG